MRNAAASAREFDWDMYACGYVLHHQKSRGEKHGDRLVYAFPCDKFRARAGLAPGALERLEDLTRHEHSICTLHHYPERTELYKAGLTDSEIAERLGLTTGCVASWRQKRRLPATRSRGRRARASPSGWSSTGRGSRTGRLPTNCICPSLRCAPGVCPATCRRTASRKRKATSNSGWSSTWPIHGYRDCHRAEPEPVHGMQLAAEHHLPPT